LCKFNSGAKKEKRKKKAFFWGQKKKKKKIFRHIFPLGKNTNASTYTYVNSEQGNEVFSEHA
jgi:hypothetical protein